MYTANNAPLTTIELQRIAPAVFADAPHHSRSDRYVYVPTMAVLDKLASVGFQPYQVSVAKVRDKFNADLGIYERSDRWGFQKHLVRLRHVDNMAGAKGGVPELVLINAHDGSAAWRMMAGFFEFLCANGLMIGDTSADFSVRHSGDKERILGEIARGAGGMLETLSQLPARRQALLDVPLNWAEQQAFARAALQLRYGGEDENGKAKEIPLEPYQILAPRRTEECGPAQTMPTQGRTIGRQVAAPVGNLWATFNVVQENMMKGGQMGQVTTRGRRRIRRQRGVNGIDQNVSLNRALWTLADEMARLKNG